MPIPALVRILPPVKITPSMSTSDANIGDVHSGLCLRQEEGTGLPFPALTFSVLMKPTDLPRP